MITKKDFVEIMTKWIEIEEKEFVADKALSGVNPDFGGFPFSPYDSLVIEALEKGLNCYNNGDGWIGWWLWDGSRKGLVNKGAIVEHSGGHNPPNKTFKLDTLDKLYDYIIKYGQDKK